MDARKLDDPEALLLGIVLADLDADRVTVPLFPPSAKPILALARITTPDTDTLTHLIETDPTLALLVLRDSPSVSVRAAVARTGVDQVRRALTGEALRHARALRSAWAKQKIARTYRHCLEVAAYSAVLGEKLSGFNADKALLCGLLHNIGIFPLVAAADDRMDEIDDIATVDAVVLKIQHRVGSMLLSRCGLDRDLVRAADEAGDWHRDPASNPDYTDLVQVARLHTLIGTSQAREIPDVDTIPSFRKIAGINASPRFGISLKRAGGHKLERMERAMAPFARRQHSV